MLIDTHAHLYWESFQNDFQEMLQRATDAGLTQIINIGVDVEKSAQALKQAREISNHNLRVFSSIGIHPEEAVNYSTDTNVSIHTDIDKLEKLYQSAPDQIVAVGECGLDFKFANNPWSPSQSEPNHSISSKEIKSLQIKLLQAQIDLAKRLNLPLFIHCRDDRTQNLENSECWDEVVKMTLDHFGIYHCYSGLLPTTHYILQNTNFLFSFAGNITYPKNDYLRQAIEIIPMDRIVVETDCPFLPPQKFRGQRNEPSFIEDVVKEIALIKSLTIEQVTDQIWQNLKEIGIINK